MQLVSLDAKRQLAVYPHGRVSGAEIVLFLPGFARPGNDFSQQVPAVKPVLGIDLPFVQHHWQQQNFQPKDILGICEALQTQYGWQKIHLLGHSLGARVWLKTLPLLQEVHFPIASVSLIAPDGIGGRYTGWLDRLPRVFFPLLEQFLKRPKSMLRLADFLKERQLVDTFTCQYLQHHLRNEQYRRLLIGTLRSIRYFRIDQAACQALQASTEAKVIIGQRDPVIQSENIRQRLGTLDRVEVLEFSGSHIIPKELLEAVYGHLERV